MISLTQFVELQIYEFFTFEKNFLPQSKINAVPCFVIETPTAISIISWPQFWKKIYRHLKHSFYTILRL
jgi:hypothetical protein